MVLNPSLLVADEPVSSLDASVRGEILALMLQLVRETEVAILVVTHDLGLAWNVADRVAVMYLGRIVEEGKAEDVLMAPQHPYTRALLSVVPEIAQVEPQILTGEAPDPTRIPAGCRFHPRCPLVESGEAARLGIEERCRTEDLALAPVADAADLLVACHAVAGAGCPPRHDTLPCRWYTDPEVLAAERARLFAPAWHYAGHLGLVAEPGSYFTCRAGDVPVVVVRDRDGVLRALVNVCRHRGAEVVSGAGRCTTLQCHYHAWTYDLDGALRAAPRSEDDPDFDGSQLGLRPAQVDTWGPFIFVHPDADAPPLADTLGPLPDDRGPRRPRRRRARLPPPRVVLDRRQLEGRSWRTSSSATTARSRTRASATSSTSTRAPTGWRSTRRSSATSPTCASTRERSTTTRAATWRASST